MSHTYAILLVSKKTYAEIRMKLIRAGYEHAIDEVVRGEILDMHGIALQEEDDGYAVAD